MKPAPCSTHTVLLDERYTSEYLEGGERRAERGGRREEDGERRAERGGRREEGGERRAERGASTSFWVMCSFSTPRGLI